VAGKMEREVADSLKRFFSAQKDLSEIGVIKSRDYISSVAVRLNNCPVGTPVRLAEPFDFDELIVVLGPNCFLRPEGVASDFIFYRFTPEEVRQRFKKTKSGYVGGGGVFDRTYDKVLNITTG